MGAHLEADGLLADGGIVFDNGDLWTHSPVARLAGPEPVLQAYDALGIAALNLGPHDYEPGWARLETWSRQLDLRFLAANARTPEGPLTFAQPDLRRSVGDVRVCAVGLNQRDTPTRTRPGATEGLVFDDYDEPLQRWLHQAWADGCELTVALIHDEPSIVAAVVDRLPASLPLDLAVAANADVFDVETVGATVVVHPGAHARAYALVEARPGRERPWELRVLRRSVTAMRSPRADAATREWADASSRVGALLEEDVGALPRLLTLDDFDRSDLGQFVCDAWLRHGPAADIALLNFGALRAALPAGTVSEGDLRLALPFDDRLVVLEITGRELASLLERGAPVVGGMTWTYRETDDQRDVDTILGPDGRAVRPGDRLRLLTLEFVAGGGDGFPVTRAAKRTRPTDIDWREPVRARLRELSSTSDLPPPETRARRLGRIP